MTEVKNINFDGVEYPVTDFSETVQNLVNINAKWQEDFIKERLALTKTEAAIGALNKELSEAVGKELAEKNKPADDVSDVEAKE